MNKARIMTPIFLATLWSATQLAHTTDSFARESFRSTRGEATNNRGNGRGRVDVGRPRPAGSGCPDGTVSVTTAPDGSAVSILFDRFMAEAGRTSGVRADRKSCQVEITLSVPDGQMLQAFNVDYRGFASLVAGTRASLTSSYNLQSRDRKLSRPNRENFTGPFDDAFTVSDTIGRRTGRDRSIPRRGKPSFQSQCGADVEFKVNIDLEAVTNTRMEQALAQLDSVDGGIVMDVGLVPCSGR